MTITISSVLYNVLCFLLAIFVWHLAAFIRTYLHQKFPPRRLVRRIKIKDVVYIPLTDLPKEQVDKFWNWQYTIDYDKRWVWHVELNKIVCVEENFWNYFLNTVYAAP